MDIRTLFEKLKLPLCVFYDTKSIMLPSLMEAHLWLGL